MAELSIPTTPPRSDEDWRHLEWEVMDYFSPGAPIDENDLFAGRTEQVDKIFEAIFQRGQHAIVYGERGVGKTSFANTFARKLANPRRSIIAPVINCDPSDTFTTLWRKVFKDLTIDGQNLGEIYKSEIYPDDVRRVLSAIDGNTVAVIVLDEFDKLQDTDARGLIANTIKALADHSVRVTLVLVGVANSVGQLIREHESISRSLIQIHMPRMKREELEEIVNKRLDRVGMRINRASMHQITALSRGLPHYTHLLGQHSAREAITDRTMMIVEKHVDRASQTCLERVDQMIREQYHRATQSPRQGNMYKEVLLASALAECDDLGFFPARAVKMPLTLIMGKPYDIPQFGQHLKILCADERGKILEQTGTPRRYRYRFVEPLMQPYVILEGLSAKLIDKQMLEELAPNYQQPRLSNEF